MKLYNRIAWKRLRLEQLRREPFCRLCAELGRKIPATIADHTKPHRGSEELFFDSANLQSLCKTCHDSIKQRFEKSGRLAGCDVKGMPLDVNHHWNAK